MVQSLDTGRSVGGNRHRYDEMPNGEYLGVWFTSGPGDHAPGAPFRCVLALMYYPQVDYAALQSGATFTIRDGPQVVGFGTVLSRQETSDTTP